MKKLFSLLLILSLVSVYLYFWTDKKFEPTTTQIKKLEKINRKSASIVPLDDGRKSHGDATNFPEVAIPSSFEKILKSAHIEKQYELTDSFVTIYKRDRENYKWIRVKNYKDKSRAPEITRADQVLVKLTDPRGEENLKELMVNKVPSFQIKKFNEDYYLATFSPDDPHFNFDQITKNLNDKKEWVDRASEDFLYLR